MIRTAVIGAGHFGREDARIYSTSEAASLVAVCDINEDTAQKVALSCGCRAVTDFRTLVGRVEAVSLAVPTVSHHSIACELLEAGIAVLVEKPIASTLKEADEMIDVADRLGAVLQGGHLERFNPAVAAASRVITSPRFFEAHRLSVFTPRSLDIDAVMGLMIHDLDVVLSLVKSEVSEI